MNQSGSYRFELKRSVFFQWLYQILPICYLVVFAMVIASEYWSITNDIKLMTTVVLCGIILILSVVYMLSTWSNSHYEIYGHYFAYKTGYLKGKIDVLKIRIIKKNARYPNYGYRPAMSFKGLLIQTYAGRSLFVSPENEKAFCDKLKDINPNIHFIE